jgi:DNA gyrase subunit A
VKEAYGDRRRTQIINLKAGKAAKLLTATDLIPEQTVWVGVTEDGLVSRTHDDKQPKHSGNDAPRFLVKASTTDTIFFVSETGKAAAVAIHIIPEAEKLSDGTIYFKVSPLTEGDPLAAVFAIPSVKSTLGAETCVLTTTRFGMIKKTLISELPGPSAQSFTLARVNDGDALINVALTDGKKELLLVTAGGMAIRFKEDDVRPMGLVAAGVNGMKLDDNDIVIGAEVLPAEGEIFLMTSDGKAKRVAEKEFPRQGRYGKGVVAWSLPKKVNIAGAVSGKPNHMATMHLSKGAPKSTRLDAVAVRKRAATKGDVVVEIKLGDEVLSVNVAWDVERFVKAIKEEKKEVKTKKPVATSSPKGKKAAPAKKAAKPAKAKPAGKKKKKK